jgi:UDP-N-acetyl-D-glucosamine dehydrogenase
LEASVELIERIKRHEARVGVIGQGYVGLPLALLMSEAGFPVTAFDVDVKKVEALNDGRSYIAHVGADRVAAAVAKPVPLRATADFSRLAECDAILICLPTPLGKHREPDLSYVLGAARTIADQLRAGQLVVLESTTYPGTTNEELLSILERCCLSTPAYFFLAFAPER